MSATPELTVLDGVPPGLLDCSLGSVGGILPGPTLLRLPGRRRPPLFVSTLLHGNEVTGFQALQDVLRAYEHGTLPRALTVFIGNAAAAASGLRRLDGQPDYNRVWPGTHTPDLPEARLAAEVTRMMREGGCFASLDIHNNSGRNPRYACVNHLEPRFLALASLFSRTQVYFTRPKGVQSMAFAEFCPAITVECGKSGSEGAREHAAELIRAALHLEHVPAHVVPRDLGVYHTVAVAHVARDCTVGFGSGDLDLDDDLDLLNFRELPAGTRLGRVNGHSRPVVVTDETGAEVTGRYLRVDAGGALLTARRVTPAMFTLDPRVIRQDCLCYLMERVDLEEALTG